MGDSALKGPFMEQRRAGMYDVGAWQWTVARSTRRSSSLEIHMPQSLAKVYLHLIFSTKIRQPVLAKSWRDELFEILGGTANNLGCQSLIVGGVEDHVHMLFQLGRTITIADSVGKIKSTSSNWVNQARGLPNEFHWQAGYAVFSVSQSNVEAVREYIRRQEEHHAKQSYQDELREWLRRYEIEWDEGFVWD
jgi:putative transposase